MNKFNKKEILFLIKPISFLSILIVLFLLVVFIGIPQVTSAIAKVNESKQTELLLNQKISILQKVSTVIADDMTFLDFVIPSKTAVLYGMSQIKSQASQNSLLVSNIKMGATLPEKDGIFKNTLTFDVSGSEASIYSFLSSFSKIIPIMHINTVKINKTLLDFTATISLNIYSSELPKVIPSVSSTAVDLTEAELHLLDELSNYTLPVFIEPKAEEIQAKEDPFN